MTDSENLSEAKTAHFDLVLPVSRVRTIMKSSPDVENISQDALYLVTAATELFVKDLVLKVYDSRSADDGNVEYSDLAEYVNTHAQYRGFLDEIIPRKMLGREILAQIQKKEVNAENGDFDESSNAVSDEDEDT